jgi:ABC-2 type transport system permease protein
MISKYFKIWKQLSALAIGTYLSNRVDSLSFFLGKLVRFGFFWLFIVSIFNFTDLMAGYNKYEVLLFFLIFNLADVLPQAFFRGIYLFRNDIRLGSFDFVLSKPVNPLFYSMTRLTDILDSLFLVPIIALIIFVLAKLSYAITLGPLLLFLLLFLAGQLIVASFHVLSAVITVYTTESENFIWLYRDMLIIGRFPPEVFSGTIQLIFTFAAPAIIMIGFPVKALLGSLSLPWVMVALLYAAGFAAGSYWLWQRALKHYQSASS